MDKPKLKGSVNLLHKYCFPNLHWSNTLEVENCEFEPVQHPRMWQNQTGKFLTKLSRILKSVLIRLHIHIFYLNCYSCISMYLCLCFYFALFGVVEPGQSYYIVHQAQCLIAAAALILICSNVWTHSFLSLYFFCVCIWKCIFPLLKHKEPFACK